MVSYSDEPSIEVDSIDVVDEELQAEVVLTLLCADCNTELSSASLSLVAQIEHNNCAKESDDGPEFEFEQHDDPEYVEKQDDATNAQGKRVPARYRKTYKGVSIQATVKCTRCGEEEIVGAEEYEQASGFESLV